MTFLRSSNYGEFGESRRRMKKLCLILVICFLLRPSSASHVMTSDSQEEPEFKMIFNEIEGFSQKDEEGNNNGEENDDEDSSSSPLSPLSPPQNHNPQAPIPTFKQSSSGQQHHHPVKGGIYNFMLDEELIRELDRKTEQLGRIDELSKTGVTTKGCLMRDNHDDEYEVLQGVSLSTQFAAGIMEKVDMIVSFLYKLKKYEARVKNRKEMEKEEEEVFRYALESVKESYPIKDLRLLLYNTRSNEQSLYTLTPLKPGDEVEASTTNHVVDGEDPLVLQNNMSKSREKNSELSKKPWYFDPNAPNFDKGRWMEGRESFARKSPDGRNPRMDLGMTGGSFWTWPYYNCSSNKNRKLMTESELEIHHHHHHYNSKTGSGRLSKSKRATYRGHPIHVHGHLNKGQVPQKLDLKNSWTASYMAWFPITMKDRLVEEYGELSLDLDLSRFEINQCGFEDEGRREWDKKENPLYYFRDTHKCDRHGSTSTCHFIPGHPWRLGSYECRCSHNKYAYQRELNNTISGFIAEAAWNTMRENKTNGLVNSVMYQEVVTCQECPHDCANCVQGASCIAEMGYAFRMVLLSFSMICSLGSIALIFVTYKFRKSPVLKSSSPLFHGITLLGCVVMYSEMIVLFPSLSMANCVGVKWTRHLGFAITYTALYMKLCRVYLTFRVKSAHKIKLTEKHLLHWMSPIMVVMLLYLAAWTISDPPGVEPIYTTDNLKFYICAYNWWDHALAIGEVIFLGYGIRICWKIRENPDARFISYSIYNIACANLIMLVFHLLIVPQAGPDAKYFLAFMRVQLSTTVTIGLVFGSKLLSVLRRDPKAMKDIPTSANGFGHETLDLAEENQQLKEELTKMATQIEKLKSYAMCKNNPHLKQQQHTTNVTSDADFSKLDPFNSL